jgi:hypothetical protein
MISFHCQRCGKAFKVDDSAGGKHAKCSHCGAHIVVPTDSPASPLPPSPTASTTAIQSPPQRQETVSTRRPSAAAPATADDFYDSIIGPSSPAGPSNTAPAVALQTNVHVKVTPPSPISNSLGIASLVLGILSFFVCWIPFIGLSFGGLGLLLGIAGFAVAMSRKGAGVGFAIAGSAVSLVSVAAGLVFATAFASAIATVDRMANEVKAGSQQEIKAHSRASGPRPGVAPVVADAQATPEKIEWADASKQGLRLGDANVSIASVKTGRIPLRDALQETQSQDKCLVVWLNIRNTSTRKKIDYEGWATEMTGLFDAGPTLVDDAGNKYKRVTFGLGTTVKGASGRDSIYPTQSLTDAIVFEVPVDGIEHLRLMLPGKAVGDESHNARFQIPKQMIQDEGMTSDAAR